MLKTKEHDDIMAMFEKTYCKTPPLREAKEYWPKGHVYANGETNDRFLAYRAGYSYGKAISM